MYVQKSQHKKETTQMYENEGKVQLHSKYRGVET